MAESSESASWSAYWNSSLGASWIQEQIRLDALFEPLSAVTMRRALPEPGEHALDIGCGCGATTIDLARAVGNSGSVTGIDISEQSLERAKERVRDEGFGSRVTLTLADAETYSFPAHAFDLAFSRLGVMFFTNPSAAFLNLHRALKRGGRAVFICPRKPAENRYISTAVDVARSILGSQAIPQLRSDITGMFSFAEPERVRPILAHAGFEDIAFNAHEEAMRLGQPGQCADAAMFSSKFGPMARIMASLSEEEQRQVLLAVADEYRRLERPDGVVLDGAFWIVTARA